MQSFNLHYKFEQVIFNNICFIPHKTVNISGKFIKKKKKYSSDGILYHV